MKPTRMVDEALSEVIETAGRIENARAGYGERFFCAVESFKQIISQFPQLYEEVLRPPKGRDIRQGTLNGFPHVVVYEVKTDEIVILSVTHGHQRNRPWRGRL